MSTNKRIAKRLLSAILTMLMLMSMVTIGMASASAATLELAETGANLVGGEVLYLKPNSNWSQAGARFAIYLFSKNGDTLEAETWVGMTKVEGETGVYEATMPSGTWKNLIFCRMNPSTTTNNWTNKWDQTNDLSWDGQNNCYAVAAGVWSNGSGSWSTYTPPVVTPEYSVTFNEGNFKVTGAAKVTEGEDYTFTVEATEGYEITKVTCNDAELTAADGTYTVADVKADLNITITVSEIVTYSVMFIDYNGTVISSENVEEGAEVKIPADPTRAGYFFTGWSPAPEVTRDDETGKWITVTEIAVFTAQYKEDSNDTPIITPPVVEETTKTWTVIFVDDSGKFIGYETVEDGKDATLPKAPAKAGYTFDKWDGEYTNVTDNRTITAIYTKNAKPPVEAPTHGVLKIDIASGTSFTLNGRPQGTFYHNTKMKIGETVTVVAQSSAGNEFIGWINAANGAFASKTAEFTFTTSGNDNYKALFQADVDGVKAVIFKNDKVAGGNGQIIDMQYYSSDEAIERPADTAMPGWIFKGWMIEGDATNAEATDAMIQAEIANGNNVALVPIWEREIVYVNVTVNGGTGGGQVIANFATTVTANPAPEGQKFAYWIDGDGTVKSYNESYKLFPAADVELTAVFVPEDEVVVEQILVSVDSAEINTTYNGLSFTSSWYVPSQYEYVTGGIVAVDKANYSEDTFYAGSTDANVFTRNPGGGKNLPVTPAYIWIKPTIADGSTWVTKAYIQYKDADSQIITVYSDIVEFTKTEYGVEVN